MTLASERPNPLNRIVILENARLGCPPPSSKAKAGGRVGLQVADVRRMPAMFGDDPYALTLLVNPDDSAPAFTGLASCCLDQRVAWHQPEIDRGLRRRIEHVLLDEQHPPPAGTLIVHAGEPTASGAHSTMGRKGRSA